MKQLTSPQPISSASMMMKLGLSLGPPWALATVLAHTNHSSMANGLCQNGKLASITLKVFQGTTTICIPDCMRTRVWRVSSFGVCIFCRSPCCVGWFSTALLCVLLTSLLLTLVVRCALPQSCSLRSQTSRWLTRVWELARSHLRCLNTRPKVLHSLTLPARIDSSMFSNTTAFIWNISPATYIIVTHIRSNARDHTTLKKLLRDLGCDGCLSPRRRSQAHPDSVGSIGRRQKAQKLNQNTVFFPQSSRQKDSVCRLLFSQITHPLAMPGGDVPVTPPRGGQKGCCAKCGNMKEDSGDCGSCSQVCVGVGVGA
jgi:hypothetical protein